MDENYSARAAMASASRRETTPMVSESGPEYAMASELIAQMLPGMDGARIVRALLAERIAREGDDNDLPGLDPADLHDARELHRVRNLQALGTSSRALQHAFNNPLTALLAEVQLIEVDTLSGEQRAAVARMLELARRLVVLSRRMGALESAARIG